MSPQKSPSYQFTKRDLLLISANSEVDWRCVKAYVEGTSQPRAVTKRVIREAMTQLGLPDPHPQA